MNLTPNEARYYQYILEFQLENDRSPSYQELADHFKVTKPYIPKILTGLETKGKIKRDNKVICIIRSNYCGC